MSATRLIEMVDWRDSDIGFDISLLIDCEGSIGKVGVRLEWKGWGWPGGV